jgi:hypothetical protein
MVRSLRSPAFALSAFSKLAMVATGIFAAVALIAVTAITFQSSEFGGGLLGWSEVPVGRLAIALFVFPLLGAVMLIGHQDHRSAAFHRSTASAFLLLGMFWTASATLMSHAQEMHGSFVAARQVSVQVASASALRMPAP